MKNLSIWGKNNPKKTILLLIFLHTLLNYFYFYTGAWLYLDGIKTPSVLTSIATFLFLIALLFYPIKNVQQGIYKNTFFRRKFWQGMTMISVALLFIHGGNHLSRAAMAPMGVEFSAKNVVLDLNITQHLQNKKTRRERRSLRKQFRKRLRANIKKLRQTKEDLDIFIKIALLFITLLAACLAALLVLWLSCGLACSGSEALALIVLVGGGNLIILGIGYVIRKLFNGHREPKLNDELIQG